MQEHVGYIEESLTESDRKQLRWGLIGFIAVPVAFTLFIYFGFGWVSGERMFVPPWDMGDYIPAGFLLIIYLFCGYMLIMKYGDYSGGVKHVYEGILQDKQKKITVHQKGTAGSRRGGGSRTSTKTSYQLTLNNKQFTVDYSKYNSVKVGDTISLGIVPRSKAVLGVEVLEKGNQVKEEVQSSFRNPIETNRVTRQNLNSSDYEVLDKALKRKLRRAATIAAIPLFMIISLIVSDYWGLVVFLFPLVIVVIWQLVSLLRYYIKYNRVKTGNTKEVFTTTVQDKQTVTRNGAITEVVLITKAGKIPVSKAFYDALPPHAIIKVSKAPYLNLVLSHELETTD